jgi:hypothetical protein
MVIYHSMFLVHGVPTEVNGHLSLNVPGTRCSRIALTIYRLIRKLHKNIVN